MIYQACIARDPHAFPTDDSLRFRWLNIGLGTFPGLAATVLFEVSVAGWVPRSVGPFMTVYLLLAAWMISLLTTVLAQALLELNARYRGTKPKRTFLQSCLFFLILQGALCPGVMLILSLLIAGVRALFRLF